MAVQDSKQRPWQDAFPAPTCISPDAITAKELLEKYRAGEKPGVDFLLVDLRRTDFEGGTITGSLNLPAQSLYYSLMTVYRLCRSAGIETVIWYCGSSRGRGTRAAGWFHDVLEREGDSTMRSVILKGGIKNWASLGEEYVELMDGYTPSEE